MEYTPGLMLSDRLYVVTHVSTRRANVFQWYPKFPHLYKPITNINLIVDLLDKNSLWSSIFMVSDAYFVGLSEEWVGVSWIHTMKVSENDICYKNFKYTWIVYIYITTKGCNLCKNCVIISTCGSNEILGL